MSEPRDVAAAMNRADRVAHHYSMSVDEVADGRATVSMTVTEAMTNGLGVCHGGLIFTLADTAMAYGSNSDDIPAFLTTATIEWLRPALAGTRLSATSTRIAGRGRNDIHDVTVSDELGETIALVRGHTLTTAGSVVERAADHMKGSR
jgi:acyl-CoA thioesterase